MKAMILCAGYGTRLGDLTRDVPKPMLPVAGRPLLAYLLGHLRDQGFGDIMINLHFRPEMIRDVFGDGSQWALRLEYSPEEQLLGTAGGVKKAEAFFQGPDPFLVQYGDVLTDQDLGALVKRHRETAALATLLVHQRARSNSVVTLDPGGRILNFLERPAESERRGVESPWVNSGICICSPEIFDFIPPGQPCDLPRDVFRKLVPTGRLWAVGLSGYRCAIDSPERLAQAREAVVAGQCRVSPIPVEAA
ncbi:MAG: NDP-sugar synthase [Verrucomicrobiales bacterium]|nr:NDP-sugar synthase [Verrucomicrobiales bacterium]